MSPSKGATRRNAICGAVHSRTATPAIKKRKLNPDLKDRVETFLNNANPPGKRIANPSTPKKRKTAHTTPGSGADVIDLTGDSVDAPRLAKKPKATPPEKESPEKRRRVFRKTAPQSYLKKLERAQTQRMVVLNRERIDVDTVPSEKIELVGSTGNIYTVTIGLEPKCTCPDHLKGNQCKHIVYALVTVLKAPIHLQYQLAFLSSELREIFANAPSTPTQADSADDKSGNRKPVAGECPICYMDFDVDNNTLVWCRAACGNNVHKSCFDQYVASQRGSTVRCVYCRTPWEPDNSDLGKIANAGVLGADGYINVAHLTGQSNVRDVSTYHSHWIRRNYYGMGF